MMCGDLDERLSLYLYGELDFTAEEAVELHLGACEACTAKLERERQWHEAMQGEPADVPLELLSKCRRDLHESLEVVRESKLPVWVQWLDSLGFRSNAWSMRIATASLLVFLGFGLSRLIESHRLPPAEDDNGVSEMSLFDPVRAHVRTIQPSSGDRVQIVVDEVRERIISGSRDDDRIRRLLLAASKDPTDPALRVDSVEMLKDDGGDDVREALIDSVQHDPNAGVRLKAMEALGQFSDDAAIRSTLISVLAHDKNPDIRTQAIDLLTPPQGGASLSPQLADALQSLLRTDPDEYIRMRCREALRGSDVPVHVY